MTETAKRIGAAALLLGASQLLSRALGIVREAVLAERIGAGPAVDAYRAAFQLPDLLNHLLAVGAIATAFIPLYRAKLQAHNRAEAARFFATVWGTLSAAAAAFTALAFAFADEFTARYFNGFNPATQAQTVRLTLIVLPAQIFFVSGGILRGLLMAEGRFGAQAAAPLFYNAAIICAGFFAAPVMGVEAFAWGALGGAFLGHFVLPLWDVRRRFGAAILRPRFSPLSADFRRYALFALPLLLGVTLVAGDEWLERYFAQFLGGGALALLFYARALMQAPVALVGQAVGTAALPALSALAQRGEAARAELAALVQRALHISLHSAVQIAAALFALAAPLSAFVYVGGALSPRQGGEIAELLQVFAFGIPAWVVQTISVRAFYARGDSWRPMLLGSALLLAALPLYAWLGAPLEARGFGREGIAAAAAIAMAANALATLALARRLHQAPRLLPLGACALRALFSALPAAVAAHAAAAAAAPFAGEGRPAALLCLAAGGAAFVLIALPLALKFSDSHARAALLSVLRRARIKKRTP